MGRVSQLHHHAKFYHFGLVNVGLWPKKSVKLVFFLYKFAPKEYTPLSDLYKILPGGGSPKTAHSCQM